jgi:hypothetical protein
MKRNGKQICLVNRSTKIRDMNAVLFDGLPCVAVMTHSTVRNHPHLGAATAREHLMEALWNFDGPAFAAGIVSPPVAAPPPYDGELGGSSVSVHSQRDRKGAL